MPGILLGNLRARLTTDFEKKAKIVSRDCEKKVLLIFFRFFGERLTPFFAFFSEPLSSKPVCLGTRVANYCCCCSFLLLSTPQRGEKGRWLRFSQRSFFLSPPPTYELTEKTSKKSLKSLPQPPLLVHHESLSACLFSPTPCYFVGARLGFREKHTWVHA